MKRVVGTPLCWIVLSVSACAHHAPAQTPVAVVTETPPPETPSPRTSPSSEQTAGSQELARAIEGTREVDVFFAFNDDSLTDKAQSKLSAVAQVLSKNPALQIQIDGNCDERGTEAYNLALGEMRAESARRYLVALGAKPEQISTISYGQERPRAVGHNEQAWQENRRDDIVAAEPVLSP